MIWIKYQGTPWEFCLFFVMTSSLRNSIHRRNHKERSQLAHRAKLGILEKHSDYVKRARDYHSKQDRLQRLRQKAADRNKDEFYFSMNKEKTKVYQPDSSRQLLIPPGRRTCQGQRECRASNRLGQTTENSGRELCPYNASGRSQGWFQAARYS